MSDVRNERRRVEEGEDEGEEKQQKNKLVPAA